MSTFPIMSATQLPRSLFVTGDGFNPPLLSPSLILIADQHEPHGGWVAKGRQD